MLYWIYFVVWIIRDNSNVVYDRFQVFVVWVIPYGTYFFVCFFFYSQDSNRLIKDIKFLLLLFRVFVIKFHIFFASVCLNSIFLKKSNASTQIIIKKCNFLIGFHVWKYAFERDLFVIVKLFMANLRLNSKLLI